MAAMNYESRVLLDWYLLFHYGTPEEIVGGSAFSPDQFPPGSLEFPVATAEALLSGDTRDEFKSALDVGCAVGRSTYELSRVAEQVIGIDYSDSFAEAAREIGSETSVPCGRYGEAHQRETLTVSLPEGVRPERVRFEQGDAMNLHGDLGSFDLVHAANLLCRLPEPVRFLERLPGLVNPEGRLLITTPATWLPEYTAPERMPGGNTIDYLKDHLLDTFDLKESRELPFVIREHKRKFQLSTAQASLWIRK
jgi:SAM-dependent methyltransferase